MGRATELERLLEWADGPDALALVTGPAGVGKTRLAIELVERRVDHGAAVLVGLSGRTTDAALVQAVVTALDATIDVRQPRPLVASGVLDGKLLVLDNFEQLPDVSVRRVCDWLDAVPTLRVLVTSRRADRFAEAGATPADVGSDAPHVESRRHHTRIVVTLGGIEDGVALLRACSRLTLGAEPTDAHALSALVARVAGNPLCIELVAARLPIRSPSEILADLSEPTMALSAVAGPFAEDITTTLTQSWALLSSQAQRVASAISCFAEPPDAAALGEIVGESNLLHAVDELSALWIVHGEREGSRTRYRIDDVVRGFVSAVAPPDTALIDAFVDARQAHARAQCRRLWSATSRRQLTGVVAELEEHVRAVELGLAAARDVSDSLLLLLSARSHGLLVHDPGTAFDRARERIATARPRAWNRILAEAWPLARRGALGKISARALGDEARARLAQAPSDPYLAYVTLLDGWGRSAIRPGEAVRVIESVDTDDQRASARLELALSWVARDGCAYSQGVEASRRAVATLEPDFIGTRDHVVAVANLALRYLDEFRIERALARFELGRAHATALDDQRLAVALTSGAASCASLLGRTEAFDRLQAHARRQAVESGDEESLNNVVGRDALHTLLHDRDAAAIDVALDRLHELWLARADRGPRVRANNVFRLAFSRLAAGDEARARNLLQTMAELPMSPILRLTREAVVLGIESKLEAPRGRLRAMLDLPETQTRPMQLGIGLELAGLCVRHDAVDDEAERAIRAALDIAPWHPDDACEPIPAAYRGHYTRLTTRRVLAGLSAEVRDRLWADALCAEGTRLFVGERPGWVYISSGEWLDLSRKQVPWRVLECLIAASERGEESVSDEHLVAAGWPGETIEWSAASNRLAQALNRLRRVGFKPWIENTGGAFRLSSALRVVRAFPM